jgi:hypothetical protein
VRFPLEQFVLKIIDGRFDELRLPAPRWKPDAIGSRARRALASADRPHWSDPRHIAYALGSRLLPRAPNGTCGESCIPGVIAYDWGTDRKLRGMLVMHGTGHQILRTQPEDSNEADAWLLTLAMLLPPEHMHSLSVAAIIERAWAPEAIVKAVVLALRGSISDVCE